MAGLMFPKGRPAALEREDRRKARKSLDEKESDKVKARSGGRCEVRFRIRPRDTWKHEVQAFLSTGRHPGQDMRCIRRAVHVHHLLGGHGVRGRGASAKAENKLHVCDRCHREIHAHVIVPDGDRFRRLT